jgi:hypothetical protein
MGYSKMSLRMTNLEGKGSKAYSEDNNAKSII